MTHSKFLKLTKYLIIILSVVFFTALVVFIPGSVTAQGSITSISVSLKNSTLDASDKKTVYRFDSESQKYIKHTYYDVYDYDNIILTVNYTNSSVTYTGNEITRLQSDLGTPFVITDGQNDTAWGTGKNTVAYSLAAFTDSAEYTVVNNKVKFVYVTPMYDIKPVFELDGEWKLKTSTDGGTVRTFDYDLENYDYNIKIVYNDGTTKSCTNHNVTKETGLELDFYHGNNPAVGNNTGYCSVGGVTASFSFTVVKNDISSVELYMTDGADALTAEANGYFDYTADNTAYFRFIYDRSKICAKVTYKDGTVADYPIGELCAKLHSQLELYDNQAITPWQDGTVTLNGKIKGISCSLTFTVEGTPDIISISDISHKVISDYSVKILWSKSDNADGYIVEHYNGKQWIKAAVISDCDTLSYTASELPASTLNKFRVKAYKLINSKQYYSKYSNVISYFTKPTQVTNLKVPLNSVNTIYLSWAKNTSADGYIIEQLIDGKWTRIKKYTDNTTTSHRVSGLASSGEYSFRVKAYKMNGKVAYYSYYSDVITGYTNPTVVSGFKVSKSFSDKLRLTWTQKPEADGYVIEILKNGKWAEAVRIEGGAVASCEVEKLSPSVSYTFRIRAYNLGNNKYYYGAYSDTVSEYTAPVTLKNMTVTAKSASAVRLGWGYNPTADGYILEQYKDGSWQRIVKLTGSSDTSYRIGGLSASTKYRFRMKAYKMRNSKAYYSYYTYVTAFTNPSSVTGAVIAGRASTALRLSWNENATADGYIIYQKINEKWVRIAKLTDNDITTYRITGLNASQKYSFKIKPYKINLSTAYYGNSTDEISSYTNPSSVAGLEIGGRAADALRLNWTRNQNADGYIIEQYKSGKWTRIAKLTNNSTTTYRISNLAPLTEYKFRIRSYKNIGNKAYLSVYASITARTNPSSVKALTVIGRSSSALRVSWKRDTAVDGYILYRKIDGKWSRIAKIENNSTVSYRISGLSASQVYIFAVKAYKTIDSVTYYSSLGSVVTTYTSPTAVTGLKTLGMSSSLVRLNWTKNDTADGYIIEQYKNGSWIRLTKLTNNGVTLFKVTGLDSSIKYTFRCKSYILRNRKAYYSAYTKITASTK